MIAQNPIPAAGTSLSKNPANFAIPMASRHPSPGYPPAWSFYDREQLAAASYPDQKYDFPLYFTPDSPAVNPFNYQYSEWYTPEGQNVYLSPMPLHCATM